MGLEGGTTPVMVAGEDRLQGWKEIAAYVKRDERTVKRWEKARGLPVRRIPGGGRANVYCLRSDLDAWFAKDQVRALEVVADAETEAQEDLPVVAPTQETLVFAETDLPRDTGWSGRPGISLMAAAMVLTVALGFLLVRHMGLAEAKGSSQSVAGRTLERKNEVVARERYLEGVYFYEQRTPISLERARRAFEEAIKSDPKSADAYGGLANTFLLLREYSTTSSEEAYGRARRAAEQAVALDPSKVDGHAALGFILFFQSLDAAGAEREFATALRLDPRSAHAHHWYGSMLMHQGRFAEAMEQLSEAQSLQPASPAILATKAYDLGFSGHRDEAVATLETLSARDEGSASIHFMMAQLSLLAPRDVRRYLEEMERYAEIKGDQREVSTFAAEREAYRRGGEQRMWSEALRDEQRQRGTDGLPTFRMAELEAALGYEDRAIQDLRMLAEQRSPGMCGMELEPLFAGLRQRSEFQEVRARMSGFLSAQANVRQTEIFPGVAVQR